MGPESRLENAARNKKEALLWSALRFSPRWSCSYQRRYRETAEVGPAGREVGEVPTAISRLVPDPTPLRTHSAQAIGMVARRRIG